MRDFMVERGQIGGYQGSYEQAVREFAAKDPVEMAGLSGIPFNSETGTFTAESLGQRLLIRHPEGQVRFEDSDRPPLWVWGFLFLHHLVRSDGAALGRGTIGYRETATGSFYFPSHQDKTLSPLAAFFSDKPVQHIREACVALNGAVCEGEGADVCAVFPFAPRFPITFQLWLPDEEFGCSANLLYDASANHYLHTEDIAVASGMLARCLMSQYRALFPGQ